MSAGQEPTTTGDERFRYLVFEGGGGKGAAFIGCLAALEHSLESTKPRTRTSRLQLAGVAGSSAGAITAFLVGLGYNSEEIGRAWAHGSFSTWFDDPGNRLTYGVGDKFVPERSPVTERVQRYIRLYDLFIGLGPNEAASHGNVELSATEGILTGLLQNAADEDPGLGVILKRLGFNRLRSDATFSISLLKRLSRHLGLFAGGEAYQWAIDRIKERWPNKSNERTLGLAEFRDRTGLDLVITGSNISTVKSELLSATTTPNFPVALAIRLSMSIPLVFTPVYISRNSAKRYVTDGTISPDQLEGFWLDGGIFDNFPLQLFDEQEKVLGVRLASDNPSPIANFDMFVGRLLANSLLAGENRVSQSRSSPNVRYLELDPEPLTLFNFQPTGSDFETVVRRAFDRTLACCSKVNPQDNRAKAKLDRVIESYLHPGPNRPRRSTP